MSKKPIKPRPIAPTRESKPKIVPERKPPATKPASGLNTEAMNDEWTAMTEKARG